MRGKLTPSSSETDLGFSGEPRLLTLSKEGIDFKWLRKVAMSAAKMERERESESVQVFLFIIER